MPQFKITKEFHRETVGVAKWALVEETMNFIDLDCAIQWAEDINKNHQVLPYHVTNVYLDSQNWCCLDQQEIIQAYGWPDVEKVVDAS